MKHAKSGERERKKREGKGEFFYPALSAPLGDG